MRPFTFAAALMLAAGPGLADSVTDMCLDIAGTTSDQCTCATEVLPEEIGEADTKLLSKTGTLYIANMGEGQEAEDAWEAALEVMTGESDDDPEAVRARLEAARQAHRDAVEQCG